MENKNAIQLFEDQPIHAAWDEEKEEWYFSVVDVVRVLNEQPDTRHAAKYWSVLKTRIKAEGGQLTTICSQLKMKSADGKRYGFPLDFSSSPAMGLSKRFIAFFSFGVFFA